MNPGTFNPYHEWLGLERSVDRPNYYQLLGLSEGESDRQRIVAAAQRALTRVRSQRPGTQAAVWSRVLDEIDAAGRCLANANERAEYDRNLKAGGSRRTRSYSRPAPRRALSPTAGAIPAVPPVGGSPLARAQPVLPSNGHPPAAARPLNGSPVIASGSSPVVQAGSPRRVASSRRSSRRGAHPVTLMLLGVGFLVVAMLLVLVILLVLRHEAKEEANSSRNIAARRGSSRSVSAPRAPTVPRRDEALSGPGTRGVPDAGMDGRRIPPVRVRESPRGDVDPLGDLVQAGPPPPATETEGSVPKSNAPSFPGEPVEPNDVESSPEEPVEPNDAESSPGEPVEPTDAEIAAYAENMREARQAVSAGEIGRALSALDKIRPLPMREEDRSRFDRLDLLVRYNQQFQQAVSEALGRLQGGDTIQVGDSAAAGVVKVGRETITLRVRGRNVSYDLSQLPPGLALALADRWLDQSDPVSLLVKAAYLAAVPDPRGGAAEKARELFGEAAKRGLDEARDLARVVEDAEESP